MRAIKTLSKQEVKTMFNIKKLLVKEVIGSSKVHIFDENNNFICSGAREVLTSNNIEFRLYQDDNGEEFIFALPVTTYGEVREF